MVYFIEKGSYSSRSQGLQRALNPLPLNEAYHQHSNSVRCPLQITLIPKLFIIEFYHKISNLQSLRTMPFGFLTAIFSWDTGPGDSFEALPPASLRLAKDSSAWFRRKSISGVALHLRCCSVPVSTLHSSGFARLASGAFYEIIKTGGDESADSSIDRQPFSRKKYKTEARQILLHTLRGYLKANERPDRCD